MEKILLKDKFFNEEKVRELAILIKKFYIDIDQNEFLKEILDKFPDLELKQRISCIRETIEKYLPKNYDQTLDILIKTIEKRSGNEDFIFAAYSEYVEKNGCTKKHLEKSLFALGEFTKHFSSEFAIRNFINKFPDETFNYLLKLSLSDNVFQRRLASEGLRPKLPWAKSINFDYKKGFIILDNLFYDKSRYVTRSLANHMHDISKIDLDAVIKKLNEWKKSKKQNSKEMNYIINHSLRTSIKKGHEEVFDFLNLEKPVGVKTYNLRIKKENLFLGDYLDFSFEINCEKEMEIIVDFNIIYPMPNNRQSKKTFKIKKINVESNKSYFIEKRLLFKKMTTKKLYSGKYKLEIQINGVILAFKEFYLKV